MRQMKLEFWMTNPGTGCIPTEYDSFSVVITEKGSFPLLFYGADEECGPSKQVVLLQKTEITPPRTMGRLPGIHFSELHIYGAAEAIWEIWGEKWQTLEPEDGVVAWLHEGKRDKN
jgi:hypothetical protein